MQPPSPRISDRPAAGPVVVVGGANVDVKARSARAPVLGTSNPGTTSSSPGGVGRNVAENLARLGTPVTLIAHVGDDAAGELLVHETAAAGVDISTLVHGPFPTGTYTAVLDGAGDLVVAVSDMTGTDALGPAHVRQRGNVLTGASLIVVDGNLTAATVTAVLDLACGAGVPVVVDPVSVPKAARISQVLVGRALRAVTPNRGELGALTGVDTSTDAGFDRAVRTLHDGGANLVWARLGGDGSILSTADSRGGSYQRFPVAPGPVVDVTGAGDAMLAAFVHALRLGEDAVTAVRHGHAAAGLTVATSRTVRTDLDPRVLADALETYLLSTA